ncbi:Aquaporin TIP3.1 [Zea mays]|uniref:Aquaporin TIP3.1 n=1 Tax=Zea mays TaxID=4577 RepID=A0A1D6PLJ4_MAIZE|nr:Aquaporin TIP3.1 [Zea mays]
MNMIRAVRRRFTVGHLATAKDPATLRHAAAELLATAIFVFAAEGATLSLGRMHHHDKGGGGLVAVALAHALALAAAVGCAANISGGHVNPAVTFGALLAGRICLVRSLVYWAAQLLGAAAMAFGLMYAYFATVMDKARRVRAGAGALAAPLAVGLLAGANVLACGALEGAVMNPARAFGPAVVGSRRWRHQWVYWVGPMVGAGLSGVVYEHLVAGPAAEEEEPAPSCGDRRRA